MVSPHHTPLLTFESFIYLSYPSYKSAIAKGKKTAQSLRAECQSLGLDTSGNAAQTENRIEEHKRKATSPETNDALAIVAAEMAASTEKDTEENAKAILEQSINEDEMHTDWEGEPVLTGNPLGVNVGIVQRNQTALLQKVGSDASRIGKLESQNETLIARLEDLELAVVEFDEFRGRFISNFKKKRGVATIEDHENVREGNRIAHTGNVKRDSGLYRAHGRKDFSAFKTLYGFHPAIAATIGKSWNSKLLSKMANP